MNHLVGILQRARDQKQVFNVRASREGRQFLKHFNGLGSKNLFCDACDTKFSASVAANVFLITTITKRAYSRTFAKRASISCGSVVERAHVLFLGLVHNFNARNPPN